MRFKQDGEKTRPVLMDQGHACACFHEYVPAVFVPLSLFPRAIKPLLLIKKELQNSEIKAKHRCWIMNK